MAREDPWHAEGDSYYHDNAECMYGGGVRPEDRLPGAGGRPKCRLCERLDRIEEELAGRSTSRSA